METDPYVKALRELCVKAGGPKAVADKARISADNLSQILAGTKLPSGNARGVGLDTDALPTYSHRYEGRFPVQAKLYPIEHLGHFRSYIARVWMPERAAGYFKERDPRALIALDKVLNLTYSAPMAANKPRIGSGKKAA